MEKPNGNLAGQKYDSAMDNTTASKADVEGKHPAVLEQPEYVGKGAVPSNAWFAGLR